MGIKNKTLVSIGVPTYNRPASLLKTLESIQNQNYENLQVVVSDNFSDNEQIDSVLSQFKSDERFCIFKQVYNIGAVDNFKFVMRRSTGDYFMWLADDDWIEPDFISKCVDFLDCNPGYVLASGRSSFRNSCGQIAFEGETINLEQNSSLVRILNYVYKVEYNSVFYGLHRKGVIKEEDIQRTIANDWYLVVKLAHAGKIKTLNDIFVHRLTGGISGNYESLKNMLGLKSLNESNFYLIISRSMLFGIFRNKFFGSIFERLLTAVAVCGFIAVRQYPFIKVKLDRIRSAVKAVTR
jgi:glycosyltransferase involved in cell wall biosynthesis